MTRIHDAIQDKGFPLAIRIKDQDICGPVPSHRMLSAYFPGFFSYFATQGLQQNFTSWFP
jgi:hypothetical protein